MTKQANFDWQFLGKVFAGFVVLAIAAAFPISILASPEVLKAIIAAGIMSVVNFLLGFAAIEFGFEKSNTTFLNVILGGMVARLMLMWATFLILIRIYEMHQPALVFSLMVFYILILALEIYFLQKKVSLKNKP
ncbi:MAG: hypothetical protein WBD36_11455 [Bacteroidota bacterium]